MRRARVRYPRAIAASLVGAVDGDAVGVEPQRNRAAPPRIDPVDHRHHRPAANPCRHLTNDRIKPAAFKWQSSLAGDDRDNAIASARFRATRNTRARQAGSATALPSASHGEARATRANVTAAGRSIKIVRAVIYLTLFLVYSR
jgi:hypothetical protein